MKFQRFGNAYVALAEDNHLYVVSFYSGNWQPWHRSPAMDRPKQLGLYGYPTPEKAMMAVNEHRERSK